MDSALRQNINRLLDECSEAIAKEGAYALLPDIIDILNAVARDMLGDVPDMALLFRRAAGLGRLVTESQVFSESVLGRGLLDPPSEIIAATRN
jgi:hypothetical protein